MPITKQRTLSFMEEEWGTYVERFNHLPAEEQVRRVNQQGYEAFRDMLAHILAWWEEGMGIIHAIAEERPFERRKYDFDVFNADAVYRYKSWDEAGFMAHFEKTRQKMESDLKSMNQAVFENRRVKAWIRAVVTHHAREHLVTVSRFLVTDLLGNEWAEYVEDFVKNNCKIRVVFVKPDVIADLNKRTEITRDMLVGFEWCEYPLVACPRGVCSDPPCPSLSNSNTSSPMPGNQNSNTNSNSNQP